MPVFTLEEAITTSHATGKIAYRGKGNIYVNITNRCSAACESVSYTHLTLPTIYSV